jgi:creatinine amidohydrolase
MKLSEMTWCEVKKYLENKKSLIIPSGTCEQHGKHLPLNTDTLVAEYMAEFLSKETGIIIAPAINYGINLPCDKLHQGTCSLTENVLRDFAVSVINWWISQGFERFYILSAHGDYFHLKAFREADPLHIKVYELYHIQLDDILEKQKSVYHACEGETSVMMYLYPETVRKESIEDYNAPWEIMKGYIYHENTEPMDYPGCCGFPSAATKEKGRLIVKRMKEKALLWIKEQI